MTIETRHEAGLVMHPTGTPGLYSLGVPTVRARVREAQLDALAAAARNRGTVVQALASRLVDACDRYMGDETPHNLMLVFDLVLLLWKAEHARILSAGYCHIVNAQKGAAAKAKQRARWVDQARREDARRAAANPLYSKLSKARRSELIFAEGIGPSPRAVSRELDERAGSKAGGKR